MFFWKYPGKFWDFFGKFPGNFQDNSGNLMDISMIFSGNFQEIFGKLPENPKKSEEQLGTILLGRFFTSFLTGFLARVLGRDKNTK